MKSKSLGGLYAVLDTSTEPAMIVCTADSIKEAESVKEDCERMVKEAEILDQAMINIGLYE